MRTTSQIFMSGEMVGDALYLFLRMKIDSAHESGDLLFCIPQVPSSSEFLEDEDLAMYTNSLGLPVAQGSTSEI